MAATDTLNAQAAPETRELVRCEVTLAPDAGLQQQAVRVDNATGDLLIDFVAVDKQKAPNRRGFVFDWKQPSHVHVDNWQANPVLLYQHESYSLPVGICEKITVTSRAVTVTARIPKMTDDEAWGGGGWAEFLGTLSAWIQKGLLRAVSIGFYIMRGEPVDEKGMQFVRVLEFEIVEVSLCSIGAHPSALIKQALPEGEPPQCLSHPAQGGRWLCVEGTGGDDKELQACYSLETADHPAEGTGTPERAEWGEAHTFDAPAEGWQGIPYTRHGKVAQAPADAPYDAMAEVKAASMDDLKIMSALESPDALDKKAGYKLAHHRQSGHIVVRDGVLSAMGVLLGARGGVPGLTDEARQAAKAHLAKHYAELNIPVPERQAYTTDELNVLHRAGEIIVPGYEDAARSAPHADTLAAPLDVEAETDRIFAEQRAGKTVPMATLGAMSEAAVYLAAYPDDGPERLRRAVQLLTDTAPAPEAVGIQQGVQEPPAEPEGATPADPPAEAAAEPQPHPLAELLEKDPELLRATVRAMLEASPKARQERALMVAARLELMTKGK